MDIITQLINITYYIQTADIWLVTPLIDAEPTTTLHDIATLRTTT